MAAGMGGQHQRQQSLAFGFCGHQFIHQTCQTDAFGCHIHLSAAMSVGGMMACGEDDIDHGQHGAESVGEFGVVWNPVGNRGALVRN